MYKAKKVLWIVYKAFRYCFPYIFVNILALSFSSVIRLSINVVNKNIVNELAASAGMGQAGKLFISLVTVYVLLYLVQMASGFLVAFGSNFYRLNVDMLFHKIFMWKSYNTPQEHFFDSSFMDGYAFISGNTNKISSYIGSLTGLIFLNLGTIAGAMGLFYVYEPLLIVYSAVITTSSAIVGGVISKKEYELDKKQIKEQRYHDYYKELLTAKPHAKELRIYGSKPFIYDKWLKSFDKLRTERLSLALKRVRLENTSDMIKLFSRFFAISILLLGIYNKKYDTGVFVMLLGLVETSNANINRMVASFMSGVYKDVKYLNDFYDFVIPITDDEIKALRSRIVNDGELAFGSFEQLELKNVSFTYPTGDKKAVDDVSLSVKRGEIVSILGYNGSSKTTLSKIMSGSLAPSNGKIQINGNDIIEANKIEAFKYFGFAPQEFSRFSLPVKEFVGLGRIEKMNDSAELNFAYEKTGIKPFISKYKNSDMTVLGKEYDDEGTDLSGGEWQRLVITSAYMGNPEILLMDEPTASIDPLREMEMIKNFRENLKGKTAVLISHRIGFARLADRIIMMENGKITEEGSHSELLTKNGYYAELFNKQKELYEEAAV